MKYKLAKGASIVELNRSIVEEVLIKEGDYLQACMLKKSVPLEERRDYIKSLEEQLGVVLSYTEGYTSFYSVEPIKVKL